MLGDYDGAIADYTLLINSDPESAGQGYYGLGSAHYLKGEWQESLADLKHVLTSDRNSWFSNYARILSWLVQVRKGDRAGADKELSDALAQGVIEPSSWEEKVCAYLIDKSKEDDFLKQAASAPGKFDPDTEAWFCVGIKHALAGERKEAEEAFKKCLAASKAKLPVNFWCPPEYRYVGAELKALDKNAGK